MRLGACVVVCFLTAVLAVSAAVGAAVRARMPVLAIVDRSEFGNEGSLVAFDSRTLARLPGPSVSLAAFTDGWSFSADRREFVIGFANPSCVGGSTALRFVDTTKMRVEGDVPLLANGTVEATDWLDQRHVLAVVRASNCVNDVGTLVFAVDATTRRVTARTAVPGDVIGVARASGRLVLLLAPHNRIGTASVAVVDAHGPLRRVRLDGVEAGVTAPYLVAGNTVPPRSVVPGLAVDGLGHAFVVPSAGPISKVTLSTLIVHRYSLRQSRSLAKGPSGPLRMTAWLPNGLLAVSGWNFGTTSRATAAGLELINPRTWTFTDIAADIASVQVANGRLFASTQASGELRSYSLNGALRYTVPGSQGAWFWGALDGRGYLDAGGRAATTVSFDLATGAPRRTVPAVGQLLLGEAAPFAPVGTD